MRRPDFDAGEALQREAAVICGGTALSLQEEVQQRWSKPANAAAEFAVDAGGCAALTYAQKSARFGLLASEIVALNAVYAVTADAQKRCTALAPVLVDTWFNRAPVETQQRKFASVASPVIGNLVVGTLEGSIGAASMRRYRPGLPVDSLAKLEVLKTTYEATGTAFAVGRGGKLATAFHVVDGAIDIAVRDNRGRFHSATVLAADPTADLAILQVNSPAAKWQFKPLPLAKSSQYANEGIVVSHAEGINKPVVAKGPLEGQVLADVKGIASEVPKVAYTLKTKQGSSGAPLINDRGAVSGVCVALYRGETTICVESSRLSELLKAVENPIKQSTKLTSAQSETLQNQLKMVFGTDLAALPNNFVHSKKSTIANGCSLGDVQCSVRFHPTKREVHVTPIAVKNNPIPHDAVWSASADNVAGSSLLIKLDKNLLPTSMVSRSDSKLNLKKAVVFYNPYFL